MKIPTRLDSTMVPIQDACLGLPLEMLTVAHRVPMVLRVSEVGGFWFEI